MLKTLSALSLILASASLYAAATSGTLTVQLNNFSNSQGVARIALYNSQDSYDNSNDQGKGAFATAAPFITNNQAIAVFNNVPYGSYAIKAYHDSNMSESMPRNFFGTPKTDYGFSNNPTMHFTEPSFGQSQFNFDSSNALITINMVQP